MSPAQTPAPTAAPARLRHRRNVRRLTPGQLADVRSAITETQKLKDDRGYQYWAGIHGLPLPIQCTHHSDLFLPWHRAYLYFFEKALQDQVKGVTIPWWNWTRRHDEGIPEAFSRQRTADRKSNSLYRSPIQKAGRREASETRTWRDPGAGGLLPTKGELDQVLRNRDFFTFQTQLESLHDGIHGWVGGTMGSIASAAYDPLFWAHHCMIDRAWHLWQLQHPGAQPPEKLLDRALPPFAMTVRDTLDIANLGYEYAAGTTAVKGPS